jgi:hypothetical protein
MRLLIAFVCVLLAIAPASGASANRGDPTAFDNTDVVVAPGGVSVHAAVGRVNVTPGLNPGPPGGRPGARVIRCWWLLKQGSGEDDSEGYIVVTPRSEGYYYTRCIEYVGGSAVRPDLQPPTLTPWPGEPPTAHTANGIVEDAVDSIPLNLPNLETSPPNNTTFVNIATYFAVTNNTGGGTATAQVDNNAIWATARAELTSATFDFGDGAESLKCATLGSLWNPDAGATYEDQPAECPHTYANPGHYNIEVSLVWDIYTTTSTNPAETYWGQHTRSATHPLTVDEIEVVTY